ncbi:cytochrome P450 [Colletotrichum acutatum]|uniref:Cytochrome P450 n=1 Tax=Glomerella acutata TaxID=27357 RepID=A0AAD8U955_GLOAC|nr:cytochrome P450 [Colletotrichum acutatum]KAK1703418.1 cytochrome P450 [Colletotrichum acutatum]
MDLLCLIVEAGLISQAFLCLSIALSILFLWVYFPSGLSPIPGHFLAKNTNVWRLIDVARGRAHETHLALHKKHGQYVRLGPSVVSIQNLEVLKTIYSIKNPYKKSDYYKVAQQMAGGKLAPTLFSTVDEQHHSAIRRPVSSTYAMGNVVALEKGVDELIKALLGRLDKFAAGQEVCDIGMWLQFYAFDVIGKITFGRPLGFLSEEKDVDGIIKSLIRAQDYVAVIGQIPWLDYLLLKNPLLRFFGGGTGAIAIFAIKSLEEPLSKGLSCDENTTDDFLHRFLAAKQHHPAVVTDCQIFQYTLSNVTAGSDTTAIALRSILYFLMRNPHCMDLLQNELFLARKTGALSLPVEWKESQQLPYLSAAVKETFRLHPPVGLLLERVVPDGGLQLPDGPFLPSGTIVGANPWVVHRHSVFGENLESFDPGRWLQRFDESEDDFNARKSLMLSASLTFGAGPRTCIGKNISLLEIYKTIPTLLLTYEFELDNNARSWETWNSFFVRQSNFMVKLRKVRDQNSA